MGRQTCIRDILHDAGLSLRYGRVLVNSETKKREPGYFCKIEEGKMRGLLPRKILRLSCSSVAVYSGGVLQLAARFAEKEVYCGERG